MFLVINKKFLIHGSCNPIWSAIAPEPPRNIVLVLLINNALMCFKRIPVGLLETKDWRRIVKEKLNTCLRDKEAISFLEYAVAVGLITAAIAAALMALGGSINTIFTTMTAYLPP